MQTVKTYLILAMGVALAGLAVAYRFSQAKAAEAALKALKKDEKEIEDGIKKARQEADRAAHYFRVAVTKYRRRND